MIRVGPLARIVAFLRADYPDGLAGAGHVPLVALLRRRLSGDDLDLIAEDIRALGPPVRHRDVDVAVRRVLRDAACAADVLDVSRQLDEAGWMIVDASDRASPGVTIFDDVCAAAVDLIPGADLADVMLARDDDVVSVAGTSELCGRLGDVRRTAGDGPCTHAPAAVMVRADDLAADDRWTRFAPAAVALGVRSCLSVTLYRRPPIVATLNVFGFGTRVWDEDAVALAATLAAHASAAVQASVWGAQLQCPLADAERISQATGVVMERHGLDQLDAFAVLRQLAADDGVGLVDMARQVVDDCPFWSPVGG
ncbi:DUF3349 domain-containing protein [Mycobacterium yunnanensis]|uniref:DUF3349 domain-containing protein n=1 Tax=Mycobacterium yunnanensis TaxID=368477 RepID=A0A9X2YKZ6_9MYCO|nr:DUF3349 domain-containing protein [Mycobacterium yunnanensis]MCV7421363.1 DUF3349 domain-containing protein [Mycobacterium yunnanensis]